MAICPQVIKRPTVTGNCLDRGGGGGGFGSSSVATVADMTALDVSTLTDNQIIFTAGYYEAGDTGGAQYRYVSASVADVDFGSVHAPDAGAGRFILLHNGWFTTKQFGCKGDGTYHWFRHLTPFPAEPTDDYPQMQAAWNFATDSGAICFISPGIHKIDGTLLVRKGHATTIVGQSHFDYEGYLNFTTKALVDGWKTSMLVAPFTSTVPLCIVRGALNWSSVQGLGGNPAGPVDPEINSYTSGNAFRNCGTTLQDIHFAAQGGSVMTVPLVTIKRVARCHFSRLTFQSAPYQALEIISADDSIFDRCYAYVNGLTGKTYAVRLRRNVAKTNEATYAFTNTLALRDFDFEGNAYGNMQSSGPEVIDGPNADTGAVTSLTMINSVGKSVSVLDSGRNNFDFYAVNTMDLVLTAAMGTVASAGSFTANEIVRMRLCQGVTFDIRFGTTGNTRFQLTRFMTMEDCLAVQGRASFLVNVGTNIPTDEYMIRASNITLTGAPKQIHIDGVMYFLLAPQSERGKKTCNVIGEPQNSSSDTLIGELIGANFNSTADQQIELRSSFYKITQILVCNASANLATAKGGIYTATLYGGTAVVAAAQGYATLVTNLKNLDMTLADNDIRQETLLYFKLTTPNGGAATADIRIYGRPMAP
jgi:hypothetical protein